MVRFFEKTDSSSPTRFAEVGGRGAFAMTQISEPKIDPPLARRRALPAAPVLIRVPTISSAKMAGRGPIRRRRLRREVRVAGYWLLVLAPLGFTCVTWGGSRAPMLLAVNSPDRPVEAVASPTEEALHRISLSVAPLDSTAARFDGGGPIFLSSELMPTDAAQEVAHGGY